MFSVFQKSTIDIQNDRYSIEVLFFQLRNGFLLQHGLRQLESTWKIQRDTGRRQRAVCNLFSSHDYRRYHNNRRKNLCHVQEGGSLLVFTKQNNHIFCTPPMATTQHTASKAKTYCVRRAQRHAYISRFADHQTGERTRVVSWEGNHVALGRKAESLDETGVNIANYFYKIDRLIKICNSSSCSWMKTKSVAYLTIHQHFDKRLHKHITTLKFEPFGF